MAVKLICGSVSTALLIVEALIDNVGESPCPFYWEDNVNCAGITCEECIRQNITFAKETFI